jgi:DNA-binding MarR family transcriptional regulator
VASTRQDIGTLAGELRVVVGQLLRRLRTQHQFPLHHGAVLGRLDREGPRSTSELAAAEGVRSQSMSQTLAELEALGLVRRHPDPTDGRRTLLELTDQGRATLAEDRARREGWLADAISERLTPEERDRLAEAVDLLRRITDA